MARCVCVHGHFYQPPRENPWLESIEVQESAAPWHDWNERVTSECYRRNSASRILDASGDIRKICNNYSRMSFNIGPTLLSWMKTNAPRCYQGILSADAIGVQRFSGHGPALAQVYNHLIMPLASRRDKETQVKWGIADFKSRFGRMPEGMWLAETAVDTETLEVLAENGIRFTILAPRQADSVRFLNDGPNAWRDVKWEKIDTSLPYRCDLPSGRQIVLFFYDGYLSQAVAFEGLLNDGGHFARRLIDARPNTSRPTLSHVATDGESYGHHHDHGDMALAYCLETIDSGHDAQLTIYGEFLEYNPPQYAVRIVEKSSWSCIHGVERWRSDCGCSNGTPGYNQKWRAPLREALDWLNGKLAVQFEHEGAKLLKDPWKARNHYIAVVLDRSRPFVEQWLAQHSVHPLSPEECTRALKLLESQRCAMLMYTSCGWFFDEISGLEGTQILRYAARAISLMHELTGLNFEMEFLHLLEKAPSNVPELLNGRRIYEMLVKPSHVSFERMAAHYGMVALFPDFSLEMDKGCWSLTGKTMPAGESGSGSQAFVTGEVEVADEITWEKKEFIFAANYRGGVSIVCGVAPARGTPQQGLPRDFLTDASGLREMFSASNDGKMVDCFGHNIFSMRHILSDARRTLLDKLLRYDTKIIEDSLRKAVHNYDELFEYLTSLDLKAPAIIGASASIVLTSDVIHAMEEEIPDIESIRRHMKRAQQWNVPIDRERLGFTVSTWLTRQAGKINDAPANLSEIERTCDVVKFFQDECKLRLSLYEAQNLYYATELDLRTRTVPVAPGLYAALRKLGRLLRFSDETLQ
jgi:alpha-amylase/alpha-mannosidase (GH57 family)